MRIGLGLVLDQGDSLFQSWAREIAGAPEGVWTRDLLWLPESIARATLLIFTPIFVRGAVLALYRTWRHNRLNA